MKKYKVKKRILLHNRILRYKNHDYYTNFAINWKKSILQKNVSRFLHSIIICPIGRVSIQGVIDRFNPAVNLGSTLKFIEDAYFRKISFYVVMTDLNSYDGYS
ncbi:hypothetical protein C7H79_16920 [Nitrosomonas supralitoralis]|uniref:Uncharacterized protein n=1 Tax=Nitrosomonas supralitoralis TaxID=2116706 RepID=A0A2P7NQR9_9PROT|nr:hypothetical protein C7H79_16920 [Nitrosomonas supralitoralis]